MDDGDPLVGVVGETPPGVADAVAAANGTVRVGDPDDALAADPSVVVAVGEAAVFALARVGSDVPVLPVDAGRGVRAVPLADAGPAVAALLDGRGETIPYPVLSVAVGGEQVARAVADVSLVTAEAAHISEYSVATDGDQMAQFRADGVVVATPAGSTGYARRVGAPVVAPGTGVAAVTPVAPFSTDPDHWVLPLADLGLRVERDEVAVRLLADDRDVAPVGVDDQVRVTRDGRALLAVVSQSRPRYP